MLAKLIKTELTTVGPLLPTVKEFLLEVPRFKQDLNNYIQVLVNSIKSVNKDAPKSDVDFFTKVVISMNPPLSDEIKHLLLGLIAVTPPQTLQRFRDGVQEGDGVIITNALRKMFDRLLEAIQAANQMSSSVSGPLQPPGPDAQLASYATFGGYRRKSRKAKKSKKAKKTQRR